MSGQTIEARVLQDGTRDLLHLLRRIHELPRGALLPAAEVEGFTIQMGTMFSNVSANCLLQAHGCAVTVPPERDHEGASKKTK